MSKRRYQVLIVLILAFTLIGAGVMALTNPEIPRHRLGPGGSTSGGDYSLSGSIGQPEAGDTLTGGDYALTGGFWGHGGRGGTSFVYLPLVIR